MIEFKTGLSKKEKSEISFLISETTDTYGDFYITKNNLRLFIKDNLDVFFDCIKKGDKIAFDKEGIAVITGFSDKMPRKYLKILAKDINHVPSLLKVVFWNIKEDLYIKVKKNNPLKDILTKNGFKFKGGRGREILLVRQKGDRNDSGN
jgi:hypothetical protein